MDAPALACAAATRLRIGGVGCRAIGLISDAAPGLWELRCCVPAYADGVVRAPTILLSKFWELILPGCP